MSITHQNYYHISREFSRPQAEQRLYHGHLKAAINSQTAHCVRIPT